MAVSRLWILCTQLNSTLEALGAALWSFVWRPGQQQSSGLYGCHHCLQGQKMHFFNERVSKVGPTTEGLLRGDTSQRGCLPWPSPAWFRMPDWHIMHFTVWLSLTLNRQNLEPVNPSNSIFLIARLFPLNLWQSAKGGGIFSFWSLTYPETWAGFCQPCQPLLRSWGPKSTERYCFALGIW